MGTGGSLILVGKAAGVLTSICCQGREWWSYTSIPPYVFMVWWLINEAYGQFYFSDVQFQ
jgi:hypothetical protein